MSYANMSQPLHGWRRATVGEFAQPHAAVPDQTRRARWAERFVPATKRIALLTVTVDEADVLRVRRTLNYSGAQAVEFVKLTRIPSDTRVRLQIGLDAEAVDVAMSKIMGSVNAAEFGRISAASRGVCYSGCRSPGLRGLGSVASGATPVCGNIRINHVGRVRAALRRALARSA